MYTEVIYVIHTLFLTFFCILAILGLADIINTFCKWIFKNKISNLASKTLILPLIGHYENIEYIIRSILYYYSNELPKYKIDIICVDLGLDMETKKICNILSRDYNCLHMVNL